MTIHAFTELHNDYPAYVNLSAQPDGTVKLSVRSRGDGGKSFATIVMTELQIEELADAIYKHNYKGEGEIDRAALPQAPSLTDAEIGELYIEHTFTEASDREISFARAVLAASSIKEA